MTNANALVEFWKLARRLDKKVHDDATDAKQLAKVVIESARLILGELEAGERLAKNDAMR